jgi:hypothetical protein
VPALGLRRLRDFPRQSAHGGVLLGFLGAG